MKLARIAAPLDLGAVLFILVYLSGKDGARICFPLMSLGIGLLLAVARIAAASQKLTG
jgi:hypothetical protein